MEPLSRVLTIFTLSVTAMHTVYSLTVAGLWSFVLERAFWWAAFGVGMITVLAGGSWLVVWLSRPASAEEPIDTAPVHPAIAGRIGPRASPLAQEGGSRRAA